MRQVTKLFIAFYCHICEEEYDDIKKGVNVRDHYHLNGKFIGAAHSKCNIKIHFLTNISVVCNNNSLEYSYHIEAIQNRSDGCPTPVIATTEVICKNIKKIVTEVTLKEGAEKTNKSNLLYQCH